MPLRSIFAVLAALALLSGCASKREPITLIDPDWSWHESPDGHLLEAQRRTVSTTPALAAAAPGAPTEADERVR